MCDTSFCQFMMAVVSNHASQADWWSLKCLQNFELFTINREGENKYMMLGGIPSEFGRFDQIWMNLNKRFRKLEVTLRFITLFSIQLSPGQAEPRQESV